MKDDHGPVSTEEVVVFGQKGRYPSSGSITDMLAMKLHETKNIDMGSTEMFVVRVPGGWMYLHYQPFSATSLYSQPVFVPEPARVIANADERATR